MKPQIVIQYRAIGEPQWCDYQPDCGFYCIPDLTTAFVKMEPAKRLMGSSWEWRVIERSVTEKVADTGERYALQEFDPTRDRWVMSARHPEMYREENDAHIAIKFYGTQHRVVKITPI